MRNKNDQFERRYLGQNGATGKLTLDQGTFTPVGAQGVPWNPPEKTTFPPEFCNEICTIYVRAIKNHSFATKKVK